MVPGQSLGSLIAPGIYLGSIQNEVYLPGPLTPVIFPILNTITRSVSPESNFYAWYPYANTFSISEV